MGLFVFILLLYIIFHHRPWYSGQEHKSLCTCFGTYKTCNITTASIYRSY